MQGYDQIKDILLLDILQRLKGEINKNKKRNRIWSTYCQHEVYRIAQCGVVHEKLADDRHDGRHQTLH